jgi:hypothetical protein
MNLPPPIPVYKYNEIKDNDDSNDGIVIERTRSALPDIIIKENQNQNQNQNTVKKKSKIAYILSFFACWIRK